MSLRFVLQLGLRSQAIILIALTFLLAGCGGSSNGQKWEYDVVFVNRVARRVDGTSTAELAGLLNKLGAEGWEVVGTAFDGGDNFDMVITLKRPLKN